MLLNIILGTFLVEGATFSHLMTSRCLTKGRFIKLLEALKAIHSTSINASGEKSKESLDMYANGSQKVRSRLIQYEDVYKDLGSDVTATVHGILSSLDNYESANAGYKCDVIHGDPVFR